MKNLELKEVIQWIMDNSADVDTMDTLNRLTYSFTRKFRSRGNRFTEVDPVAQGQWDND